MPACLGETLPLALPVPTTTEGVGDLQDPRNDGQITSYACPRNSSASVLAREGERERVEGDDASAVSSSYLFLLSLRGAHPLALD